MAIVFKSYTTSRSMSNSTLTIVPNYLKAFKNDWVCKIGKVKKGENRNIKSDNLKSYIDWGIL